MINAMIIRISNALEFKYTVFFSFHISFLFLSGHSFHLSGAEIQLKKLVQYDLHREPRISVITSSYHINEKGNILIEEYDQDYLYLSIYDQSKRMKSFKINKNKMELSSRNMKLSFLNDNRVRIQEYKPNPLFQFSKENKDQPIYHTKLIEILPNGSINLNKTLKRPFKILPDYKMDQSNRIAMGLPIRSFPAFIHDYIFSIEKDRIQKIRMNTRMHTRRISDIRIHLTVPIRLGKYITLNTKKLVDDRIKGYFTRKSKDKYLYIYEIDTNHKKITKIAKGSLRIHSHIDSKERILKEFSNRFYIRRVSYSRIHGLLFFTIGRLSVVKTDKMRRKSIVQKFLGYFLRRTNQLKWIPSPVDLKQHVFIGVYKNTLFFARSLSNRLEISRFRVVL